MWRDHGVRHLVLVNLTPMQPSLRRGVASMPLMTTVIRRMKRL
jgi:phthiodiolone/phenolphthiodiolone dimycocerosates ketoreductase